MMHAINISASTVESLTKHEIIKDVLMGAKFSPSGHLSVDYPAKDTTVAMGNTLPIDHTQVLPKVHYLPSESHPIDLDATYTLIMTDPDAPSRTEHKWSEYCHYVETGIKLTAKDGSYVSGGRELQSYVGPAPPKGTGLHRYIFLLYKEPKGLTEFTEIKDRINWGYGVKAVGVDRWAKENKLELLAVNFFFAENK